MRTAVVLVFVLSLATAACGTNSERPAGKPSSASVGSLGSSMGAPTWSRDGDRIAWADDERIWVAGSDGSDARPVTRPIDALGQIAWLPDRRLLYWANFRLFFLETGGRSRLFTTIAGGDELDPRGLQVANDAAGCLGASCPGPIEIWQLATGRRHTIGGRRAWDMSPTFSPDGRSIALARSFCRRGTCDRQAGVWVTKTSGGGFERVTRTGICPSWSPNGRSIAYVDSDVVRLVPAAGGRSMWVMGNGSCAPRWSPDSRRIAAPTVDGRLNLIERTPSGPKIVFIALGRVEGFAWSPDGSRLLVAARPTDRSCSSLWVVRATSGSTRLLRRCSNS